MKEFENKIAIIIGGTSGIGYVTAKALLDQDAIVHIVGRNIDKIGEADNLIKHKVDISQKEEVDQFITKIGALDSIDCLVNASGMFSPKSFLEHTVEDYDAHLNLNRGFFFITQALSFIHMCRSRRSTLYRCRWTPYHSKKNNLPSLSLCVSYCQ
mgnify:CR=1 FL=1